MRVQGVGSLALDGRIGNCFAMLVGLLVTAYGTIERNREIGTREKGAGKRKETRVDRMPVGRASGRERSIERKKRRERGSRDNRPAQCDNSSDIPFCLFLMLVKLCNRAGSRGAKGWRLRVAIVSGWGGCVRSRRGTKTQQNKMGWDVSSRANCARLSLQQTERSTEQRERASAKQRSGLGRGASVTLKKTEQRGRVVVVGGRLERPAWRGGRLFLRFVAFWGTRRGRAWWGGSRCATRIGPLWQTTEMSRMSERKRRRRELCSTPLITSKRDLVSLVAGRICPLRRPDGGWLRVAGDEGQAGWRLNDLDGDGSVRQESGEVGTR